MQLSIIIATKNEQNNILTLLKSLKAQSRKNFEIILVDNFSHDKTQEIAKPLVDKVITAGSERSAQRNIGAKSAEGTWLFFLDADMELPPNLLRECIQKIQKNTKTVGLIIGEQSKGSNFLSRIKAVEKILTINNPQIEAARFFKKSTFLKLGGFDENLISGEDWDLSIRANKLGQLVRINTKIIHHENLSFWQDIKKKYYYAINIQKYAKKHPEEFKKQAGIWRFFNLFKNPKIIFDDPAAFLGLIFLKFTQYLAYLLAKSEKK